MFLVKESEESIIEDSKRTLSLKIIKRALLLRNLRSFRKLKTFAPQKTFGYSI